MARAISFYEDLLEIKVYKKDEIYSILDINGFRLGLFNYQAVKEKHSFGHNSVVSIEFDNLNILKRKLRNNHIIFPLTKINDFWVSEIMDSEGNPIELTCRVKCSVV